MKNGSIIIAEHLKKYKEEDLHTCEVHVNLWKDAKRQGFKLGVEYLLDIGIKIYEYKNTIESLTLFFPFDVEKSAFTDLGKPLSESKSLVNTVFNENLKHIEGEGEQESLSKYESKVKDEEKQKQRSFWLYILAPNNYDVSKKDGLTGTFFTIKLNGAELPDGEKDGNLYIRFRAKLNNDQIKDYIKREEDLANDVLQAAFSKTELYDVRINDRRETDDKVLEEIETSMKNTLMPIRKAHFFFITNVVDKVSNGNSERMDTRMLEMEKWKSYAGYVDGHPRIAYHWKKSADAGGEFENFEIFFRNTCDNRSYHKIILYLFVAFWIGSVGSLIGGLNCETFPWIGAAAVLLMTIVLVGYYCRRKL